MEKAWADSSDLVMEYLSGLMTELWKVGKMEMMMEKVTAGL